jgi:formylglycine-generating enzyme required for sulfatase activity
MRWLAPLAVVVAWAVAAACGQFGVGDSPDAGTSDAGGFDAGIDASPCGPARAGPTMIDVGGYCIDATEVTEAHYAAFLKDLASGYDAGARPVCAYKHSYTVPDTAVGVACNYTPDKTPNVAVVCVDWCDAEAYCRWAGKRLCGAIDGGALSYNGDDTIDPNRDAWYRACSHAAARLYAYGAIDPTACNVKELNQNRALDAGAEPKCVGGFDGLFDMNGNVDEQQDACDGDGGENDHCRYRGGSWYWAASESSCLHRYNADEAKRGAHFADVGFRCCSR